MAGCGDAQSSSSAVATGANVQRSGSQSQASGRAGATQANTSQVESSAAQGGGAADPSSSDESSQAEETWESIYMANQKVGYGHTRIVPIRENGQDRIKVQI
jgi:hypothetical protein